MCKYYHFTNYENLKSISENGLVPKSGSRTRSIGDKRCAVFLSEGITNSILMYSSLLHHYNSYTGENGIKAINFYKKRLDFYTKREKKVPLDEEDVAERDALVEAISWINEIMEYKDFSDYIGDGVYLTVSGIIDVNSDDKKDCYTTRAISPENINIILLKNKNTGEIIDSRESVLAYFMSINPVGEILHNISNVVTHKNIRELYNKKMDDISHYNCYNFKLEEMPISIYLSYQRDNNKRRRIS